MATGTEEVFSGLDIGGKAPRSLTNAAKTGRGTQRQNGQ